MKIEFGLGLNLLQSIKYKYSKKYRNEVDEFVKKARKELKEKNY